MLSGRCTYGSDSDGRVSDGQRAGRVPAFVHLSRVEGEGGLRSGGGWFISAVLFRSRSSQVKAHHWLQATDSGLQATAPSICADAGLKESRP